MSKLRKQFLIDIDNSIIPNDEKWSDNRKHEICDMTYSISKDLNFLNVLKFREGKPGIYYHADFVDILRKNIEDLLTTNNELKEKLNTEELKISNKKDNFLIKLIKIFNE